LDIEIANIIFPSLTATITTTTTTLNQKKINSVKKGEKAFSLP
jgi:hypothetical protein